MILEHILESWPRSPKPGEIRKILSSLVSVNVKETEKKPAIFCIPLQIQDSVLSGILLSLLSNSLISPLLFLLKHTHSQKRQSLSHWSITSSNKLKTLACALPKCLNSFRNSKLFVVTPILKPSLLSLQGWGIAISVQNQLLPTSSYSCMAG